MHGWAGQADGGRAGRSSPLLHPPHLQLIACGRWPAGVCLCVGSSPRLLAAAQSIPNRGALTGPHDEAESEADSASRWPFSLSHTHPLPGSTQAHTHSPSSRLNSQRLRGGRGGGGSTDHRRGDNTWLLQAPASPTHHPPPARPLGSLRPPRVRKPRRWMAKGRGVWAGCQNWLPKD